MASDNGLEVLGTKQVFPTLLVILRECSKSFPIRMKPDITQGRPITLEQRLFTLESRDINFKTLIYIDELKLSSRFI